MPRVLAMRGIFLNYCRRFGVSMMRGSGSGRKLVRSRTLRLLAGMLGLQEWWPGRG